MSKETIDLMIEGGKAVAGAQMGQSLGPLGVNIQLILKSVNDKTAVFKGMKVPVKIIVDTVSKDFEIEVGSPPTTELVKKELGLEKGSGKPNLEKIKNVGIEQAIKLTKMKEEGMLGDNFKRKLKTVIGSLNSMGILVEGKISSDINKEIEAGKYNHEIQAQKIDITPERIKELAQQLDDFNKLAAKLAAEKEAEEEAGTKPKKDEEVAATATTTAPGEAPATAVAPGAKTAAGAKPAAGKPEEAKKPEAKPTKK
ncbi:50S ribosomal protein L11 [Candidatus Woesearchaeota archaeon]|nr:hypothetical protein [uncultured archaeon]MBS3167263.1 50S ribosomal protein L11 [Candidatus Woesearchaeota archaeon]